MHSLCYPVAALLIVRDAGGEGDGEGDASGARRNLRLLRSAGWPR